jgi:MYXO-CTERM domain-containing protein
MRYVNSVLIAAALLSFSWSARSAPMLTENFDSSATLPAGWTFTGSASISTDSAFARSGTNSLNISNLTGPSATTPSLELGFLEGLDATDSVTFSFWWTTDVHGGAFGRTPFIQYSSDGVNFQQIGTFTVPANVSSIPAPQLFSRTLLNDNFLFTDNSQFRILGDSSGGGTQAPIFVDDLEVTATPSPSAAIVGLAGIGGLMLRRRRQGK